MEHVSDLPNQSCYLSIVKFVQYNTPLAFASKVMTPLLYSCSFLALGKCHQPHEGWWEFPSAADETPSSRHTSSS